MKEPWDQLATEDDDLYSYFLIYRNLGLRRSLRKAYCHYLSVYDGFTGSHSGLHLPGNWRDAAVKHFWSDRATSWDIRNLHAYGSRVAVFHTKAINNIAEKCMRLSATMNPGDPGWSDLLDSMEVLQRYLTPDVVRGIAERNQIESANSPPQLAAHSGDGVT